MNKLGKVMLGIWMVLAIAAFVLAFFTSPLFAKIIGLVFGGMNVLIILSLAISVVQGYALSRKMNKMNE